MACTPALQRFCDTLHRARIGIAGRAYLHGGRSRQQKLDRVFRGGDAAQATDRNGDRASSLIDHAHGNRLDRWAGKASGVVGNARAAGLNID